METSTSLTSVETGLTVQRQNLLFLVVTYAIFFSYHLLIMKYSECYGPLTVIALHTFPAHASHLMVICHFSLLNI